MSFWLHLPLHLLVCLMGPRVTWGLLGCLECRPKAGGHST